VGKDENRIHELWRDETTGLFGDFVGFSVVVVDFSPNKLNPCFLGISGGKLGPRIST